MDCCFPLCFFPSASLFYFRVPCQTAVNSRKCESCVHAHLSTGSSLRSLSLFSGPCVDCYLLSSGSTRTSPWLDNCIRLFTRIRFNVENMSQTCLSLTGIGMHNYESLWWKIHSPETPQVKTWLSTSYGCRRCKVVRAGTRDEASRRRQFS